MTGQPPTPVVPADKSRASRKISNSLVALSSAAVLAVYTAGYLRTKPAADRFTAAAAARRAAAPAPAIAAPPVESSPQSGRQVTAVGTPPSPGTAAGSATAARPSASVLLPSAGTSRETRANEKPETPQAPVASDTSAPQPLATLETVPAAASATPPAPSDIELQKPASATRTTASLHGPYADGTYVGWGYSRHGDIEATVVVEGGRIASAEISQCRTRYSCGIVAHLPGQVLGRQRAAVDFVSGATQSSYAYEDAVAEALSKAK